ncbi:Histidinol-phosphate aminotransferase [Pseudoclavibacter triregionum]|nr:Histidinol-phosphate aminotransferase [Pseudoclavibacter triregionum]
MTSLADLPIRDDLRGQTPYGAPMDPVSVALNVNENPHPVPEPVARHVIEEIARILPGLNRYPDREFTRLREQLAAYLGHGLTKEHLWAANGSNEVLQQLLQAFAGPGRRVLAFPPTYSMHPILTRGVGAEWVTAERDPGYEISPETAVEAIRRERPDVTFFCTPNNPTGTSVSNETIATAYDATEGIVIVDEAYAEFKDAGSETALDLLEGRPRLVVSRTMSKAFAFAGARLGYFAADPAVADAVRLVRLPYHLSAITQAAASAALDHAPLMLEEVAAIRAERVRIEEAARELGYRPVPSSSNFVLIEGFADPHAMFGAMLARDVLIRDVGLPGALRVSAGTHQETTRFIEALRELTTPETIAAAPTDAVMEPAGAPATDAPAAN